jgi:selenium metabolism protein YedF
MNGSIEVIDTRGMPCPAPVVALKKAAERAGFSRADVLVDGSTARDNVLRFAKKLGLSAEASERDGYAVVHVRVLAATPGLETGQSLVPRPATGAQRPSGGADGVSTVLIASDELGHGERELGELLMRGFVAALSESDALPERIILMNSGVKLALRGAPSAGRLSTLAEKGVQVLACGTCLDYLGAKDSLAVGRVSNMFEIVEALSAGRVLAP